MTRWRPGLNQAGANAANFRTTHWSVVLTAGDQASPLAAAAMAQLCQTYWLPIYAFIRKRGSSPEQAQDLTQEFFAGFLEKNYVSRAARDRGRFRSFLMASVENFLCNEHDHAAAQKRGGGAQVISIEGDRAEQWYLAEPVDECDPARVFEQRWASTLLSIVLNRLRGEFTTSRSMKLFENLQPHLWGDAESVPYPQLAERLQMSLSNVKISAHRARQRYRELLREEIAHTVATPSEVDEEIRYLMRVVSE
jgi:RNA polymerase sigma factor (sigma-70 family)